MAVSQSFIFLSYSQYDRKFCEFLAAGLEARVPNTHLYRPPDVAGTSLIGVPYFYDQLLRGGENWVQRIQQEILNCPIFIVVLSQRSVVSPWVREEVNFALARAIIEPHRRQIIPIQIEECHIDDLAPLLTTRQVLRYSDTTDEEQFWLELVQLIEGKLSNRTHTSYEEEYGVRLAANMHEGILSGRWHYAEAQGEEAVQILPTDPNVWTDLGNVYLHLGKYDKAIETLAHALTLAKFRPEIWRMLAIAYSCLTPPVTDRANDAWRKARAYAQTDEAQLAVLADQHNFFVSVHDWHGALSACEAALEFSEKMYDPTWAVAKLNALAELHLYSEALAYVRIALDHVEDQRARVVLLLKRAVLADLESANDVDIEVEKSIEEAARIAPDDPAIADARQQLRRRLEHFPPYLAQLTPPYKFEMLQGVEVIIPPVVPIPGNDEFWLGSDLGRDAETEPPEMPCNRVSVKPFWMAVYPVTVAEYACAVRTGAVPVPETANWDNINMSWTVQLDHPTVPVTCIKWFEALEYCRWLTQLTGHNWRLPTEVEWEYAARGTDSRIYPWGNEWRQGRANVAGEGPRWPSPVGYYPMGASPYGILDMAGNVYERTISRFVPYPYDAAKAEDLRPIMSVRRGSEDETYDSNHIVVRGGAWYYDRTKARTSRRNHYSPYYVSYNHGIRLVYTD